MKAMIFAAGFGTRLKPLTDTIPKALVPVGGKPLIHHLALKLKDAGIRELVINVHHFPDSIIQYIRDQDDFGMTVHFSDERDLLRETGGGIRFARTLLISGDPSQYFLVHNVDILSNLDVPWLLSRKPSDALAVLVVSERKTRRYYLFDDAMRLVGWTNLATGEVRSPYPGLDPDTCRKFAFAGIHLVSEGIFRIFEDDNWDGRFSITDFYLAECAKHPIYGIVPPGLQLLDVGKLESLPEAEKFLKKHTLNF